MLSKLQPSVPSEHFYCGWPLNPLLAGSPSHFLSLANVKKSSLHLELWEPSPSDCSESTLFKSESFLNKQIRRHKCMATLLPLQFIYRPPSTFSCICIFNSLYWIFLALKNWLDFLNLRTLHMLIMCWFISYNCSLSFILTHRGVTNEFNDNILYPHVYILGCQVRLKIPVISKCYSATFQ